MVFARLTVHEIGLRELARGAAWCCQRLRLAIVVALVTIKVWFKRDEVSALEVGTQPPCCRVICGHIQFWQAS